MKKIVFCLLIFTATFKIYGQDKDYFSAEINASYYYYSVGPSTNMFNYGFSLLASKYLNRLKVSSGIDYATMFWYYDETPVSSSNYLSKTEYRAKYFNIPIICHVEIYSKKLMSYSILLGVEFNKLIDYDIKSYYLYDETLDKNIEIDNGNLELSIITGATISRLLSNRYKLNITPFIYCTVVPENDGDPKPSYKNIPDGRYAVGCKIGFEYLFKSPVQ